MPAPARHVRLGGRRTEMPPGPPSRTLVPGKEQRHDDVRTGAVAGARLSAPPGRPTGRLMPSGEPGAGGRLSRWRTRSHDLAASAKRAHARAATRFPVITHLVARMISVNIFDSATRLAAQCFLTAVPLLFVVASIAPDAVRNQLISSIRAVFGLNGAADDELQAVFGSSSDDLQQATGVVGALMVLLSATAVSRAMQRLCKRAWELPRTSTRIAVWRWPAWILVWLGFLLVQAPLREGFGAGLWLGIPLTLLSQTALWWWTQHLLLGGLIRWAPLLPGAVLTAIATTVLSVGARFYMPRALNRVLAEYGSIGSVFVILSWLIVVCVAVAVAISAGAVAAQEPSLSRRLGSPPPGWAHAERD
ncbi:YhjD/YihY/BrkB family envelope integrity protein [Streptomyces sp. NPDC000410]|uniref:YhjD/YihY/BrkB family envelope integrity protein n=1 Tax=Streptomyces sp. NPDC000410 TaxID=3154254 RepID=UPI00331D7B47